MAIPTIQTTPKVLKKGNLRHPSNLEYSGPSGVGPAGLSLANSLVQIVYCSNEIAKNISQFSLLYWRFLCNLVMRTFAVL